MQKGTIEKAFMVGFAGAAVVLALLFWRSSVGARNILADRDAINKLNATYRESIRDLTESLRSAAEGNAIAGEYLGELGDQLRQSRDDLARARSSLAESGRELERGRAASQQLGQFLSQIAADATEGATGNKRGLELDIAINDGLRKLAEYYRASQPDLRTRPP